MKRIIFSFLVVFLFVISVISAISLVTDKVYVNQRIQRESREVLYRDFLLGTLSPYILDAIKNYYGEYRLYTDEKVIDIKRIEGGRYNFEVTVQVTTFVGPHNPPYGIETITLRKESDSIKVIDYKHKKES